jgi:hypothetical protein
VRIVDGVLKPIGQGTTKIPTTGSIAVADSYAISSSTAGVTEEQLWVHDIEGGQADVYSTPAGFSVTCKTNPAVVSPTAFPAVTLHPLWLATRDYKYQWTGLPTSLPEHGTGGCTPLCVGWVHIHQGDSAWLSHFNDYFRGFLGYDPAAIKNLHVARATLTLTIATGESKCFGGVGRAVLTRTPIVRNSMQTFEAPYPDDGDFNFPTVLLRLDAGSAVVDVTSIVQGWASSKMVNQGFVLRGKVEDNGSDANDSCTLEFLADAALTISSRPVP